MGICHLRQEYRVYTSMHALHLGPLVSRNKGVFFPKIGLVKLSLPEKLFLKILVFGKQENPGESDSMPQEGTLEIEFITHRQKSVRFVVMLRHLAPVLHRIGTNKTVSPLPNITHCD